MSGAESELVFVRGLLQESVDGLAVTIVAEPAQEPNDDRDDDRGENTRKKTVLNDEGPKLGC